MSKFILIFVLLVGTANAESDMEELFAQAKEEQENKALGNIMELFIKDANISALMEACGKSGVAKALRPDKADVLVNSLSEFRRLQLEEGGLEMADGQGWAFVKRAHSAVYAYYEGVKAGAKIVLDTVGDRKLDFCDLILETADEMLAEEAE